MSHHFRCCACRGRNVLPRHWRDYARPRRCKHCRSVGRFYVDKERLARQPCRCAGAYHWPGPRPGSPMCERNPLHQANRARRAGADDRTVEQLIQEATTLKEHPQPGLDGFEPARAVASMHVAVLGSLWRPARVVETAEDLTLEIWLKQPGSALPVCACMYATPGSGAERDLLERARRLQQIGTVVLARGEGLGLALVDGRECLRIALTSDVDAAALPPAAA